MLILMTEKYLPGLGLAAVEPLLLSKLEVEIFQGLFFDTFTVAWFLHLLKKKNKVYIACAVGALQIFAYNSTL